MMDRVNISDALRHAAANEYSELLRAQEQRDARIAGIRRLRHDSPVVVEDVNTDLREWLARVDPQWAGVRSR
ncbi:MAG TPA: hypothetical protein VFE65_28320 [Pseudonocardia sp.]|jgi:hypothetical protein|nr:hypothetical protein [Pseudonocardia sp.]